MPKEIAEYLNKMGARIPNIKPGKATVEYLTKIQASTRFWGIRSLLSPQHKQTFPAKIMLCVLLHSMIN